MASFSKALVLDIYSGFINNFSVAMDLAKMEAKRKSALADFLKVKQIGAHDRLSFFGLMVKPVQRFPQFILFLQVSCIILLSCIRRKYYVIFLCECITRFSGLIKTYSSRSSRQNVVAIGINTIRISR